GQALSREDDRRVTDLEPLIPSELQDAGARAVLPPPGDNVLLSVRDLCVRFNTDDGIVHAVEKMSLDLHADAALSIVGEPGSGKSVTSMAILGLLPKYADVTGSIRFRGEELLTRTEKDMRAIRGAKIAMIFQDALASLNPVFKVGDQIGEAISVHQDLSKKE